MPVIYHVIYVCIERKKPHGKKANLNPMDTKEGRDGGTGVHVRRLLCVVTIEASVITCGGGFWAPPPVQE